MSDRNSSPSRDVRRITLWGLAINLALSALKFTAGILGASQALVADAVHSLSDSVTDVAVVVGAPLWSAPADAEHPHGHGRIETVITLFIGVVLAAAGAGLGYRAVATLHHQHAPAPGWLAFTAACISIAAKEWLYRWTVSVGRRIKSSAVAANAWHHRSDALSSVPVAIAVLGTRIWPSWKFLDHVATVIVSVLILNAAWQISWPSLRQLIDVGAAAKDRDRILSLASGTEGVQSVHALRTRYIGNGLQVDLHVLVDPEITVRRGHEIAEQVTRNLRREGPDIVDVLVHIEPFEAGGEEA
ncbi:MAG: cation transporter [Planctomycetes bacterium]|nr:cation transporter [Planctomycetota bacterium]